LECRLKAGEAARVEEYLQRYPELGQRPSDVLELIAAEYALRRRGEPALGVAEYLERFPGYREELPPRLHGGVGAGAQPPEAVTHRVAPPTVPPAVPHVPGYEILGELGRGGMGIVYQARQLGLDRVVALKMILAGTHAGTAEVARFRTEAEAIARLRHPNIVAVYEVGEHQGKPFFSLEFCEGGGLDRRLAGNPLPPEKAAELVGVLAGAMQAAHAANVIHRDLKPANVLLTGDGTPKITDFGLARKLDEAGQTQSGAVMGTPSYMAPEQAQAKKDVGPAADVYALGAILYECLTGRPPFKAATAFDTLLQVVSEEPVPPRQLNPKVPIDLGTICLKCLHKQPHRRYATAGGLAEDLRRFQSGEPVQARPVGRTERAWRWCRRNPAVAGLLIAVAVTLLLGTGVASFFAVQARAEAWRAWNHAEAEKKANEQAQQRLAQVVKANEILASVFHNLDPRSEEKEGKTLRVLLGERLGEAVKQLEGDAVGDREAVARLQYLLGNSLRQLGLLEEAEVVLAKARRTQEELLGASHPETISSLSSLGLLYQSRGRYDEAETLFKQALEAARREFGTGHPDTLTGTNNLASLYQSRGRYDEAERLLKQALEGYRRKLGADHPYTLTGMNNLASLYQSRGRYDEAELLFQQALEAKRRKLGANHPDTLLSMSNLAFLYQRRGRYEEAEPLFQQALEGARQKLGADHPDTLMVMNNLAEVYQHRGRYDEAEALSKQLLEARRRKLGADHPDTLTSMNNLALLCQFRGRYDEAETLFKQALEARRREVGASHPHTLLSMNNLASLYQHRGQYDKAEPLYKQALEGRRRKLGADHPDTLTSMNNLALLYHHRGRFDEAEPLYKQALEGRRRKLGAGHPDTLSSMYNLAAVYCSQKKFDPAIPLFKETLRRRSKKLGADHPDTVLTQAYLGVCYHSAGRLGDGVRCLEQALARARKRPGPLPVQVAWVPGTLTAAYDQAKQFGKAEPLYRAFVEQARKQYGTDDPRTAGALAYLGLNLLRQSKHAAAEKALRDCLAVLEKKAPDAWTTFNIRSMLGEAVLGQRRYADAEALLRTGYGGMKEREGKIPPKDKVYLTEALQRLVRLYDAWDKPDEAARWRKELDPGKPKEPKAEAKP
jgi:tetratricopeptide (TPR) repeat protein